MAKMVFHIHGYGDHSVGIWDTIATVTIEDNFTELDKEQQELMRQYLFEFYDIPKGRGTVLTLEEYTKEQEAEQRFYDEMQKEHEDNQARDRELSELDYIQERTQATQD